MLLLRSKRPLRGGIMILGTTEKLFAIVLTGLAAISMSQLQLAQVGSSPSNNTQSTPSPSPTPIPAPMPPGPNPNSQYRLGPDSLPQEGVPKGEIRGPYTLPSKAYPGTQHTYWIYVPAQYAPAV